ncbi:DUF3089 domain-containing protein [Siphonobacter sp. SORGH_AS_0500]|uniref:DUF3089 domain-containing protein n=1 Tax=Siphonobacter sp. SORGH_AS_0500 TaxID=1864824 RepID=UPI00286460C5|nr:DUF3089 domain-containing protein [Siphonobacter sp. SORGH_AS_0500]MDR6197086.1 hypothetical protein [Siphonobacter sp. SORGH_AS_0500]
MYALIRIILIPSLLLIFTGCFRPKRYLIESAYSMDQQPNAPDYSNSAHWATLPDRQDAADFIPRKSAYIDQQSTSKVDVFFIHPTLYAAKPEGNQSWNADVNDARINARVDSNSIINQATVFNGSGRIYSPRYRQAHYSVFVTKDTAARDQALALAYSDVKKAFEYYLRHYNKNRPIIIASHSQGSIHAIRLIQDFFDGKELQAQLVAAYLIGRPISKGTFKYISPIETPGQAGTFASWCTFKKGYHPEKGFFQEGPTIISTNPLLWNTSDTYASRSLHRGGVGLNFKFRKKLTDAQNHNGLLWISKPRVPFGFLLPIKNWHVADINMFYGNLRENVALQVENYFKTHSTR